MNNRKVFLISLLVVITAALIYKLFKRNSKSNDDTTETNPTTSVKVSGDYILYNFYSPHCGYCRMFKPQWEEAAKRISNKYGITVRSIDATLDENSNIVFYYNINAFPTVIVVTPKQNYEYSGNRTADDLERYVASLIK